MAKTTASASGTKRYRATPARKNIGKNTMQIHSVETSAGSAICCAPFEDGRGDVLAHLQVAINVFDLHRRVVDEDAHRQREAAEGHDVDGLAQGAEDADGAQDRERDGHADDHRVPPLAQKEQDHHGREHRRDGRLREHAFDRRLHEDGLIEERLDGQGRVQRGEQLRQPGADGVDDVEREELPDLYTESSAPRWPSWRTMLVCGVKPSRTLDTSRT